MDIMNVLRTDMNISISRIRVWVCYRLVGHGNVCYVKNEDAFTDIIQ